MFDINNDGKQDWHDDYIYHKIIQPQNDAPMQNKHAASNSSPIGCLGIAVIFLLFLISK